MEPTAEPAAATPLPTRAGDVGADGELVLTLPADLSSPKVARSYVRQTWPDLDDETLEDIELITTELVSNAVRHGAPEIALRLRRAPFAVDVGVLDHGDRLPPPSPTQAALDADRGRGLYLVDRLSNSWRVEPLNDIDPGKTVWASIDTRGTRPGS